jgi:4-hydroxybenzoate polyprenyltransferase
MSSRLRALRLVHPFPSFLNSLLVLGLAVVAGGAPITAAALAIGMLGIQFCIGAVNDICDVTSDAQVKSWKPLPAGLVSDRQARAVALVSGAVGIGAALALGPIVGLMAVLMLGCGLLYDVRLKRTPWAWACYAVAFATLPVYAWFGATGQMPPLWQFVVPLAALAGPALQLSNSLVDLERDRSTNVPTLATRLGRRATLATICALLVVIYALAWATLSLTRAETNVAVAAATACAAGGLLLQARASVRSRELGWSLQAIGIALLALGWLFAVS